MAEAARKADEAAFDPARASWIQLEHKALDGDDEAGARAARRELSRRKTRLGEVCWDDLEALAASRDEMAARKARGEMERRKRAALAGDVSALMGRLERAELTEKAKLDQARDIKRTERAGQAVLIDARASETALQGRTVLAAGMAPATPDQEEDTDTKGGKVYGLRARNTCAVIRLHADGAIDEAGVRAAQRYRSVGDRVLGRADRVKTTRLDDSGGATPLRDEEEERERDADARALWDEALCTLTRHEATMLDLVLRYGWASGQAAGSVWPNAKSRDKLQGMGDATLISACDRLAVVWGFSARGG